MSKATPHLSAQEQGKVNPVTKLITRKEASPQQQLGATFSCWPVKFCLKHACPPPITFTEKTRSSFLTSSKAPSPRLPTFRHYHHVRHAIVAFITCRKAGRCNPKCTFVGTQCGCQFHPSQFNGWLICNILVADLGFELDLVTRFNVDKIVSFVIVLCYAFFWWLEPPSPKQ